MQTDTVLLAAKAPRRPGPDGTTGRAWAAHYQHRSILSVPGQENPSMTKEKGPNRLRRLRSGPSSKRDGIIVDNWQVFSIPLIGAGGPGARPCGYAPLPSLARSHNPVRTSDQNGGGEAGKTSVRGSVRWRMACLVSSTPTTHCTHLAGRTNHQKTGMGGARADLLESTCATLPQLSDQGQQENELASER